jgi:fluoroacetyl-CoA thioesterase
MTAMQESLAPGIEETREYEVLADMSPAHLPVAVLSTPSMIGLIEGTCLGLTQRHLDEDETSVGTHVCVSHEAAVNVGERITVWCQLKALERRRLEFDVRVEGPRGQVSSGTHQRAVIKPSRLG